MTLDEVTQLVLQRFCQDCGLLIKTPGKHVRRCKVCAYKALLKFIEQPDDDDTPDDEPGARELA